MDFTRKQKENKLLIAYGFNKKYLIQRIDIISKYWINKSLYNIKIPLDIIKLITLFLI